MTRRLMWALAAATLLLGGVVSGQMTPWLQWTLLPKAQVAERLARRIAEALG